MPLMRRIDWEYSTPVRLTMRVIIAIAAIRFIGGVVCLTGCQSSNPVRHAEEDMGTDAGDAVTQPDAMPGHDMASGNAGTDGGNNTDMSQGSNQPDMLTGADMLVGPDMIPSPDLLPIPDLALLCMYGTTNCNGACTNTQTDANNCGICGNKCSSGTCVAGACVYTNGYTHHDTFCSNTWTDNSPTVDPTNPNTAAAACAACCYTATAVMGCACTHNYGNDSYGNWFNYYYFNAGDTSYRFFYQDATGQYTVGMADQFNNAFGRTNVKWWKQ